MADKKTPDTETVDRAKKPAAKSTTTKSTAKSTAAKSAAAKKPAQKKAAALDAEATAQAEQTHSDAEQSVVEEQAVEKPVVEEQTVEEQAVEKPVVEEQTVEEQTVEEQTAEEQTAEEQTAEKHEVDVAAETTATAAVKKGFADKVDAFFKGKGKLPIFIIFNVLFVAAAVALFLMPFSMTLKDNSIKAYSLISYFENADAIKQAWVYMAGEWADIGYIVLMVTTIIAILIPLALVVKNIVLCIKRKKDFSIYKLDAVIYFAFMFLHLAAVNLFGANVSVGIMAAFVVSAVNFALLLFTLLISKESQAIPFFSLINILLAMAAIFVLTGPVVKLTNGNYLYAANAGEATFAIGYFVTLAAAIVLLVALMVMQIVRLPKIVEIIIPIAAAVCVAVSVAVLAPSLKLIVKPEHFVGATLAPGYVIGVAITALIAVADTLFAFVRPLQKLKKTVYDCA